jgi:hypothetical protein
VVILDFAHCVRHKANNVVRGSGREYIRFDFVCELNFGNEINLLSLTVIFQEGKEDKERLKE